LNLDKKQSSVGKASNNAETFIFQYLNAYLTTRDFDSVAAMLHPKMNGVGTGADEVVVDLAEALSIYERDLQNMPEPIEFVVRQKIFNPVSDDVVVALLVLDLHFTAGLHQVSMRGVRFTFVLTGCNDIPSISHMHISTASEMHDEGESYPMKEIRLLTDRLHQEIAEKTKALEKFRHLFEGAENGILVVRGDTIEFANPALERILGHNAEKITSEPFITFIHPDDRATVFGRHVRRMQGEDLEKSYDFRVVASDGTVRWINLSTQLINWDGDLANLSFVNDITERKRAEEALKMSEFRARAMLQAIPDMVFRLDSHGVFLDYKADIRDLYAQDVPTIIGKHNRDILPPEFVDLLDEKIRTALETGLLQTFEYQLPIPDRGVRDYECRMIRSAVDEVTAIVRDITERKHHEQKLSAALIEKEVLLREVHHRVKNNLAAIISLMDLQRRAIEDPGSQVILTELSNRIRSMSLVHEKLYRADSLARIDFHDYTQALVSHLRTTFGSPGITCRVDVPGITIPLDLASPCGLIVNELMTNALKYAFPDGTPRPGNTDCRVLVHLRRDKDTYTLTVADNGIGWPPGFDWTKTRTLGMTLVRMLGQHQLGGRYVVEQKEGTSITLTFTNRKKEVPAHG